MSGRSHLDKLHCVVLVILCMSGLLAPLQRASADAREQTAVTGMHEQQQFVAGTRVRVHDARIDDLFAAGGQIMLEKVVADDVYVVGGSVRYSGVTVSDFTSAGGELLIDAVVDDDLIAAGGRVRLESTAQVAGDVVAAAGELELAGRVGGHVTAAAGRIVLRGQIDGDVELVAGEVVVDSQARIGGRLRYRSDDPARIADGAVIEGGVEHARGDGRRWTVWAGIGAAVAVLIVLVLGIVLLAAVARLILPGPVHHALEVLAARPGISWLLGFGLVVAVPVAANIALLTVIGAPIALVVYAAYLIALALGVATAASAVGSWLMERTSVPSSPQSPARRGLASAIGAALLVVIGALPIIGWLALLGAIPLGVGAFALAAARMLTPSAANALA